MGDFTTNHTGDRHEWFLTATGPGGKRSPERDYYIWEDGDYVAWLGVPTLPKLNHLNTALRHRLFEDRAGVVRKWLGRSGGLDGWRVDVANMTGRWRGTDVNHDVARQMRDAMARWAPGGAARRRARARLHRRHAGGRLARRDELLGLLQAGLDLAARGEGRPQLPRGARPGAAARRRGRRGDDARLHVPHRVAVARQLLQPRRLPRRHPGPHPRRGGLPRGRRRGRSAPHPPVDADAHLRRRDRDGGRVRRGRSTAHAVGRERLGRRGCSRSTATSSRPAAARSPSARGDCGGSTPRATSSSSCARRSRRPPSSTSPGRRTCPSGSTRGTCPASRRGGRHTDRRPTSRTALSH